MKRPHHFGPLPHVRYRPEVDPLPPLRGRAGLQPRRLGQAGPVPGRPRAPDQPRLPLPQPGLPLPARRLPLGPRRGAPGARQRLRPRCRRPRRPPALPAAPDARRDLADRSARRPGCSCRSATSRTWSSCIWRCCAPARLTRARRWPPSSPSTAASSSPSTACSRSRATSSCGWCARCSAARSWPPPTSSRRPPAPWPTCCGPSAAWGLPVLGVISDCQESIRLAVAAVFPGVPHQLCQYHALREAAEPLWEADRHLLVEAKMELRGAARGRGAGAPARRPGGADRTRSCSTRCWRCGRSSGRSGHAAVRLRRAAGPGRSRRPSARRSTAAWKRGDSRLARLRTLIGRAQQRCGARAADLRAGARPAAGDRPHAGAGPAGRGRAGAHRRPGPPAGRGPVGPDRGGHGRAASWRRWLHPALTHLVTVLRRLGDGLYHCYDVPDLPRTDNGLEQFYRRVKACERRITGHRRSDQFVMRVGECGRLRRGGQ